jgi:tRNA U34 5-methylaminomethyl-2-thiouridine-forming methyltransferase MnmC
MQFVITNDGSPTIYDPSFKEHHHSLIGAYTEARYKFAELSKNILEQKNKVQLLDLPFGLGYNLIATIDLAEQLPNKPFIECTAIEKDLSVIQQIAVCPFEDDLQTKFNSLKALSFGENKICANNFSVELIIADLRETLPRLHKTYDLIFYDPFSPKTAPELWSKENVLFHLARLLSQDGLLITYTASNKVRKGLQEVGLNILPGAAVGRKMPGTIASKNKLAGGFTEETLAKILKAQSY